MITINLTLSFVGLDANNRM